MDPSTPPSQNTQNQTPVDQAVNRAQPPQASFQSGQPAGTAQTTPSVATPQQPKMQTISVNKESGPATIAVPENPIDNDEEEIQVAPQETKSQVVQQSAGAEVQEIEMQPSI